MPINRTAGMKQDHLGRNYYLSTVVDSRGNVLLHSRVIVSTPDDAPPLTISLIDPGSRSGHEWIITPGNRRPVDCHSPHCPICQRERLREEKRAHVRKLLGV